MSVKLLTEHYLEFLSLKGGCTDSSESTLVKYHIVRNYMSRLNYYLTEVQYTMYLPVVQYLILTHYNCKDSKYCYQPAGHIVTGDLKFINDSIIRSIISKRPNNKLPSLIDLTNCRSFTCTRNV